MFINNILVPLTFFFLIYLVIQIIKATLFFIYLVQRKEYRLDRIKAHFRTKSGKNHLWHYFNLLKWRKLYRPRFTLRASVILILTFIIQYNFFFFALRFLIRLFKGFSNTIALLLILALFLLNFITPLVVFSASFFSFLLLWPIKKAIVILAEKRIKKAKNLLVIGITGSYGKTAVKEILSFILADFFKVLKTPANCNTELGIASLIMKKLRASHEIFVVEMGAYKQGEIKKICRLVRPKMAIVTAINEQHLELFGSLAKTQWAKYELVKSLPKDGWAIFNAKNSYTRRLYKMTKRNKRLYGQKRRKFKTKLLGSWHRENIEAALEACDFLKLSKTRVLRRLAGLERLSLGLKIKKGKGLIALIRPVFWRPWICLRIFQRRKKY